VAGALSGLLNLVGAFLSLAVAATIASGLVNTADVTLTVVAAGLAGGIIWNLITWLFGIPSSSPHALIGGVIGSTLAAAGGSAVKWHGLTSKVIIPAALSPIIAALVAATGTWLLYRISRNMTTASRSHGFRIGQVGSACMVSLAHGTNDAQKTMGVITLALIANGTLPSGAQAPFWVILSCALAISAGTYIGGWRVIRTLGKGLVEIESPQGMAAESSSAAVILLSSSFGYSLSTTHVATGSIIGTGLGKRASTRSTRSVTPRPLLRPSDRRPDERHRNLIERVCHMALPPFLSSIIGWLRAGYPEGVPDVDYIPLFALLGSQLTNDEVTAIAEELETTSGDPESAEAIKRAISAVTDHQEPKDSDVARVRARLAAGGWPLAKPQHFDPVHWP
jgi:phosphate/sulfate permease